MVRNKAIHIALGVRADGGKEVLGLWLEQNEGAKFWLRVMNELRNRGVKDILLAVVDGLKGFPEAIDRLGGDLDDLDQEIAKSSLDDAATARLITITGVNLTVAAGLMAAIGDIRRFSSPQKVVSYVDLNPRVRQSGLGLAQHGRISKAGRSHARVMLVEAAWAAAKAPGPLHTFFVRIRAKRGHQIAAVAVARKLTVLCWHLLTKEADYRWARPALIAAKRRAMELQSGQPQKKGNKPGPAHAYNIKALRDQEMQVARQAEQAYEHFVAQVANPSAEEEGARTP